jgi:hypothetical protein
VSNILMPEDPAFQRYERLVDALGTGPTHSAYEQAALARIVSWASRRTAPRSPAWCARRAVTRSRSAVSNAQAEEEGTE